MFKKLLVAAVVGGLVVAVVKNTKAGREAYQDVRNNIRAVFNPPKSKADKSPEERIAELEEKHQNLKKVTLPKKIHDVAKAQVEYQQLEKDVKLSEERVTTTQKALAARLDAIKKANGQVSYDGKSVPVAEALVSLERDTNQWKLSQQTLATQRAARDQARKNAETLEEQLRTLVAEIDRLGAEIKELRVTLAQVRLEQMKSEHQADDGPLAETKNELQDVRKLVEVEKQKQLLTNQVYGNNRTASALATPAVSAPTIANLEAEIHGVQPAQAEKPAAPEKMPQAND